MRVPSEDHSATDPMEDNASDAKLDSVSAYHAFFLAQHTLVIYAAPSVADLPSWLLETSEAERDKNKLISDFFGGYFD
jgi:hypothetical protein